jgi:nucleotide-binding universal stress UspA family protein
MYRPAIVVGYDGSPGAGTALRWAVDAAVRHGAPLRLVCAAGNAGPEGSRHARAAAFLDHADEVPDLPAHAAVAVAVAETRASWATKLTVTGAVVDGPADAAMCAQSDSARMLVLGSRGLCGFTGRLPGSVSVAVAARARCPVVAVRNNHRVPGPDLPVGVALDGAEASFAALRFATEEATARRVRVLAIRVWNPLASWYGRGHAWDATAPEAAERQALETTLRRWRDTCPLVPVTGRLVAGHTGRWLAALSRETQLMVVGTGSAQQSLLRHAACPVAVVPQTASPASRRVPRSPGANVDSGAT